MLLTASDATKLEKNFKDRNTGLEEEQIILLAQLDQHGDFATLCTAAVVAAPLGLFGVGNTLTH